MNWRSASKELWLSIPFVRPFPDDIRDGANAVCQCGRTWLKDNRRLDLVKRTGADGRCCVEAWAGADPLRPEALAALGTENDIGCGRDYVFSRNDPVLGAFEPGALFETRPRRLRPR